MVMKLRIRVDMSPELVADLKKIPPRARGERLRSLAMLGLACLKGKLPKMEDDPLPTASTRESATVPSPGETDPLSRPVAHQSVETSPSDPVKPERQRLLQRTVQAFRTTE